MAYLGKNVVDYFSRIPKYTDLVAKWLAIYMTQTILDIVYIYNMHVEADHFLSKVEDRTASHNKANQPHGSMDIYWIVNMYD